MILFWRVGISDKIILVFKLLLRRCFFIVVVWFLVKGVFVDVRKVIRSMMLVCCLIYFSVKNLSFIFGFCFFIVFKSENICNLVLSVVGWDCCFCDVVVFKVVFNCISRGFWIVYYIFVLVYMVSLDEVFVSFWIKFLFFLLWLVFYFGGSILLFDLLWLKSFCFCVSCWRESVVWELLFFSDIVGVVDCFLNGENCFWYSCCIICLKCIFLFCSREWMFMGVFFGVLFEIVLFIFNYYFFGLFLLIFILKCWIFSLLCNLFLSFLVMDVRI